MSKRPAADSPEPSCSSSAAKQPRDMASSSGATATAPPEADGASANGACSICLGAAINPVRSCCCGQQFCAACVRQLRNPGCPYCRSGAFSVRPLRPPTPPPPPPRHRCQATGCQFAGSDDAAFLAHLVNAHGDHLLRHHHLLFQHPPPGGDEQQQQGHHEQGVPAGGEEPVRDPQLGENRKFYCGARLNGPPCQCCPNGICGPREGCNCVECMIIDLMNFDVSQSNTLVNKFGRVASRSTETGRFYCAFVLDANDEDGSLVYCGPIEGPNCEACSLLDVQAQGRYASLM